MSAVTLSLGTLALLLWMFSWTAREAGKLLPAGEGRDEVIAACTSCHGVDRILRAAGRDEEAWGKTLDWMQKMQGMRPVLGEERRLIIGYLATSLHETAAKRE